jgi:hypothetical protein
VGSEHPWARPEQLAAKDMYKRDIAEEDKAKRGKGRSDDVEGVCFRSLFLSLSSLL